MARGYPDFEGPKSGVYSIPEWAAKEATDKNVLANGLNIALNAYGYATYLIPTDKTLYITGAAWGLSANVAAEFGAFFYGDMLLKEGAWNATGTHKARVGGVGGGVLMLSKPIAIAAGEYATVMIYNRSNLAADWSVCFWGYEV